MKTIHIAILATLALSGVTALAQQASRTAVLPPGLAWNGKSRALVVPKGDRWITPSEVDDLRTTPSYDQTVAWLQKLVAAAPQLKLASLGKSPEGRDIWMVIASKNGASTPQELQRNGRPTVFAQAGIHSGEIDGKDAGLMLLRDMTVRGTKKSLLDKANFLFVPIYSVDAHERSSEFGRINQRGPVKSGWRTTARNLNLNRDYMKLDALETRAMISALNRWNPELYIDLHVTDGADYQYDVTYGFDGPHSHSPNIARWLQTTFVPRVDRDLLAMGHIPGRFVQGIAGDDLAKGIIEGTSDPRFSNGYGTLRHMASILVENHSLKPYDQRVLGMYVLLESALRSVADTADVLRAATIKDRNSRRENVPLTWTVDSEKKPEIIEFLGIESRASLSAISGAVQREWLGRPVTMKIPLITSFKPSSFARRPKAYWIPAASTEVIDRLRMHGISMEQIKTPRTIDVEMLRVADPKFAAAPFEGRIMVTGTFTPERRKETFAANSVRVVTDQPLGDVAMFLLEPASPDSFFQWGFFHEILQRTEYVESYVMEPMAERMLAEDPKLAAAFEKKLLEDEKFRASSSERLQWFYARTPFQDERWRLYPVGIER